LSARPSSTRAQPDDRVLQGSRALLGARLVARGALTEEQLALALGEQRRAHRPLGEILLALGFVAEEDVARLRAEDHGLAFAPGGDLRPDPALCAGLDTEFVQRAGALPLARTALGFRVAITEPDDPERLQLVRARFPGELELVLTTRAGLARAARDVLPSEPRGVARLLDEGGAEASVELLVQALLEDAIRAGATDLHLEPEAHLVRVRWRIDGLLAGAESLPRELALPVTTRLKILAGLDIAERRRPQDGRMRVVLDGRAVDLRVALLPCADGENVAVRILDRHGTATSLGDLGLAPRQVELLRRVAERPHGLFLVTGPTGAGKTTTLYALLAGIDALARNVVTIEDPIEVRLPLVRQTQIDPGAGLDFGAGLRGILRQDPDVILVGEIRDRETAEMALRAALTGHLVLSTLHTSSALGALPRLSDLGVDPLLVEDALIGVLGQRLVRRLCSACAVPATPGARERAWLGEPIGTPRDARGCERCGGRGWRGRIALAELFLPDDACAAALRARASVAELAPLARAAGFVPLLEGARELVRAGITTRTEVERVCRSHRLEVGERA
jgi:type II secretory ATPase GspE/PulE/Tfp pilus assembly ATPase PilB-like protein